MHVSVVICTRNRSASLHRALASIAANTIPADLAWEVLVVNNASNDDTVSVAESFSGILPLRLLYEPELGLSRARNQAVAAAMGDYIVWTDDDVEVGAAWLASYVDAFSRFPASAVFGGKINPILEHPVPNWLLANRDALAMFLATRDFGDDPVPLSVAGDRIPFGANFAVRSAEQRLFPYDTSIGAGSAGPSVGEETTVIKAMLNSGRHGVWVPGAVVDHHIAAARVTPRHVARWFAAVGFTMEREAPNSAPLVFGVPRWIWRDVAERYLRYRFRRATRPAELWIQDLARYSVAQGRLTFWQDWHAAAASTTDTALRHERESAPAGISARPPLKHGAGGGHVGIRSRVNST